MSGKPDVSMSPVERRALSERKYTAPSPRICRGSSVVEPAMRRCSKQLEAYSVINNVPDERFQSDSGRTIGRFGDTVRRKTGFWTPSVHELLQYLEKCRFAYAPRVLLSDDPGVEVLTFMPGTSGREAWPRVATIAGLAAFARLLRTYHDAVRAFEPTIHPWALTDDPPTGNELVCHCDFAPWNIVWDGHEPVGILDWDFASPRDPLLDIGHALEFAVPFRPDDEAVSWLGYASPPDRRARLETFAGAYGLHSTAGLVDAVIAAQEQSARDVARLAGAGIEPQATWVASGHLAELKRRAEWTRMNRSLFEGGTLASADDNEA